MDTHFRWINSTIFLLFIFVVSCAQSLSLRDPYVSAQRVQFQEQPNGSLVITSGHKATLSCSARDKAGKELPISWRHNDKPLNVTSGLLVLEPVTKSMHGWYDCAVQSEHGTVLSTRATLGVRQVATLRMSISGTGTAPDHLDVAKDTVLRLQCVTDQSAHDPLQWWKDGRRLEQNNLAIILQIGPRSVLQINSARSEDSGQYECRRDNVTANIQVTVHSAPKQLLPQWVSAVLPANQSVGVGHRAVFECLLPDVSPTRVAWRRTKPDNAQMPLDRTTVLAGSFLVLDDVNELDAGLYECFVEDHNKEFVKSVAVAELTVNFGPRWVDMSQMQDQTEMVAFSTNVYTCVVQARPPPSITWYKDGVPLLHTQGDIKIEPMEISAKQPVGDVVGSDAIVYERSLKVLTVISDRHNGVYQCRVTNELGEISAAAMLKHSSEDPTIHLNLSVRPQYLAADEPKMMFTFDHDKVKHTDEFIILLNWYCEDSPGKPLCPLDAKATNNELVDIECDGSGRCSTPCCSVNQLAPYRDYVFWLSFMQLNQIAQKPKSSERITATTFDAVCHKAIPLSISDSQGGSVSISWQTPTLDDLPGTIDAYLLYWRPAGSTEPARMAATRVGDALMPLRDTINGLQSGQLYEFLLVARTAAGAPERSVRQRMQWTEHRVPQAAQQYAKLPPPDRINIRPVNSSSIRVGWSLPRDESLKERTNGFAVFYAREGETIRKREETSHNQQFFFITGLQASTDYRVSVAAVDDHGVDGFESSQPVRTASTVTHSAITKQPINKGIVLPPPPPMHIYCKNSSMNGKLHVHWEIPQTPSQTTIVGYRVRFSPKPAPNQTLNASTVKYKNVVTTELEFDSLPGALYLVAIQSLADPVPTLTGDGPGEGPFSPDQTCRSSQTRSSAPLAPNNVRCKVVNTSTTYVQWRHTPNSTGADSTAPLNLVLSYVVHYKTKHDTLWTHLNVNGHDQSVLLESLEEGAEYSIRVSAVSAAGESVHSDTVHFTQSYTQPQAQTEHWSIQYWPVLCAGVLVLLLLLLCVIWLRRSLPKTPAAVVVQVHSPDMQPPSVDTALSNGNAYTPDCDNNHTVRLIDVSHDLSSNDHNGAMPPNQSWQWLSAWLQRTTQPSHAPTHGRTANGTDGIEMETLLVHNTQTNEIKDSKGGSTGARPRGCERAIQKVSITSEQPVNVPALDLHSLANEHLLDVHSEASSNNNHRHNHQLHTELLIPLHVRRELAAAAHHRQLQSGVEHNEWSSDLSHSPATASSLHSWSHDEHMSVQGSASLPNLTDSGIGFDQTALKQTELSHTGHHLRQTSASRTAHGHGRVRHPHGRQCCCQSNRAPPQQTVSQSGPSTHRPLTQPLTNQHTASTS